MSAQGRKNSRRRRTGMQQYVFRIGAVGASLFARLEAVIARIF
jgi:hypothetical protein